MTPEEQDIYWHQFNSFQQRMEKKYTGKLTRVFKNQINSYLSHYDINKISSAELYTVLKNLYIEAGTKWAHRSSLNIRSQKARMPMGFSERIIELMREFYGVNLYNLGDEITSEIREFIAEVLTDAALEGFGYDEIVKRLTTEATLPAIKARRIARTEVTASANAASMLQAKETGLALNKVWISVRDRRRRNSHMREDNVTIDINEPFIVGEGQYKMMQPGVRKTTDGLDVPASEVVNCRCCVAHIVKRDANGRLIRT